jgi:hypothetical protein
MKRHAGAFFKDRLMAVTVIASAFGGKDEKKGGAAKGSGQKTGATKRVGDMIPGTPYSHLPSWFKRRPGRQYKVYSIEAPNNSIQRLVKTWGGGGDMRLL